MHRQSVSPLIEGAVSHAPPRCQIDQGGLVAPKFGVVGNPIEIIKVHYYRPARSVLDWPMSGNRGSTWPIALQAPSLAMSTLSCRYLLKNLKRASGRPLPDE